MTEVTVQLVEYRNAVYQGGFSKGRREGKGILITDSGEIFVGTWKNDCLNDKALIWLSEKKYVIGDFNRGLMDGQFVYRDAKGLFYAEFTNNKLTGKMVYLDESEKEKRAKCLEYRNLNYNLINQRVYSPGDERKIFRDFLGYENMDLPDLKEFIKNQMLKDGSYYEAIMPLGHTYIGFHKGDTVEKVGFCFSRDELVSYGVYVNKLLDGAGFKLENNVRLEGMFKAGMLNGMGIKHNVQQNKYTFGFFEKGTLKELNDINDSEMDNPPNITAIKRDMHIKSLYFFNSYVKSSTMLKYRGYEETLFRSSKTQREYLFPETSGTLKRGLSDRQQEDFPILRKLKSEHRAFEDEPTNNYSRLGPSKLDQSQKFGQEGLRRKLFEDEQVDINPQRDFRGANKLLNKLQQGLASNQQQGMSNDSRNRNNRNYNK